MSVSSRFGVSLSALGALGLAAVMMPACSSSDNTVTPPGDGGTTVTEGGGGGEGGTASYCGAKGASCCAAAGQVPNPECDDGDETQCPATAAAGCKIASTCGDTTTCMPLASNTGGVDNFRMRRIIIVAPKALANSTVQNTVVTSGVNMKEPQCGEGKGTGDFNWLLSFDTNANTLKTGGAPPCDLTDTPSCDPYNTGYCFVNKTSSGLALAPVTAPIVKGADGTYSTTGTIPTLNIPIYFGTPISIITLPISNGAIEGVKISNNGNCIGSVNTKALAADCSDNYQACSKWLTDGSLTGYITLKTADTVNVALLNESLCAVLTGQKGADGKCPKDASGNIDTSKAKGDYCSTTLTPGGCNDAFWLAATFAASAVKIDTANTNPDCQGGGTVTPDAGGGTDSGGGTDASGD